MDWTSRREKWRRRGERNQEFFFIFFLFIRILSEKLYELKKPIVAILFSVSFVPFPLTFLVCRVEYTVKLIGEKLQERKKKLLSELPRAPSARVTPKNRSSASSTCFSNPYALRHDKSIIRGREKFGGIAGGVLERMGKIDLPESLGHRDLLIRFVFNLVKFRER